MNKITLWFIAAVAALVVVYDSVIISLSGKEASVSWSLIQLSYQYPMIVFCLGFVCGHLFWRMKDPKAEGLK